MAERTKDEAVDDEVNDETEHAEEGLRPNQSCLLTIFCRTSAGALHSHSTTALSEAGDSGQLRLPCCASRQPAEGLPKGLVSACASRRRGCAPLLPGPSGEWAGARQALAVSQPRAESAASVLLASRGRKASQRSAAAQGHTLAHTQPSNTACAGNRTSSRVPGCDRDPRAPARGQRSPARSASISQTWPPRTHSARGCRPLPAPCSRAPVRRPGAPAARRRASKPPAASCAGGPRAAGAARMARSPHTARAAAGSRRPRVSGAGPPRHPARAGRAASTGPPHTLPRLRQTLPPGRARPDCPHGRAGPCASTAAACEAASPLRTARRAHALPGCRRRAQSPAPRICCCRGCCQTPCRGASPREPPSGWCRPRPSSAPPRQLRRHRPPH